MNILVYIYQYSNILLRIQHKPGQRYSNTHYNAYRYTLICPKVIRILIIRATYSLLKTLSYQGNGINNSYKITK